MGTTIYLIVKPKWINSIPITLALNRITMIYSILSAKDGSHTK
ncbi:uncharacterized protein G2W53_013676 [Senna tora]|uniref:Uncharacterized protein n=1 Tax=Senna tora TaxID=362788 RepID=A0A834TZ13_9FABA|nr:uncharacterized protein G2W53_013676 [Senna tora]